MAVGARSEFVRLPPPVRAAPAAPCSNAVVVVPRAEGDPVSTRVAAPARAKHDVVILQLPPSTARRHLTAPAVASEHRVGVARQGFPIGDHVIQQSCPDAHHDLGSPITACHLERNVDTIVRRRTG